MLTEHLSGQFTSTNPLMKLKGVKHQMTLIDAVKKMKSKKRNVNEERKAPGAVQNAIDCVNAAETISGQRKCLSIDKLLEGASELMDEDTQLFEGQFDDAYESGEEIIASSLPKVTPAKHQMRGIFLSKLIVSHLCSECFLLLFS